MTLESLLGIATVVGVLFFFRWRSQRANQRVRRQWETAVRALDVNDIAAAEAGFRGCIEDAPIFLHARWLLAETLARQGRFDEAEDEFRSAIDFEPRNAEAHLNLGMFHFVHRDNRTAAVAAFVEAVRLDPDLRMKLLHEPRLRPLVDDPAFDAAVSAND